MLGTTPARPELLSSHGRARIKSERPGIDRPTLLGYHSVLSATQAARRGESWPWTTSETGDSGCSACSGRSFAPAETSRTSALGPWATSLQPSTTSWSLSAARPTSSSFRSNATTELSRRSGWFTGRTLNVILECAPRSIFLSTREGFRCAPGPLSGRPGWGGAAASRARQSATRRRLKARRDVRKPLRRPATVAQSVTRSPGGAKSSSLAGGPRSSGRSAIFRRIFRRAEGPDDLGGDLDAPLALAGATPVLCLYISGFSPFASRPAPPPSQRGR